MSVGILLAAQAGMQLFQGFSEYRAGKQEAKTAQQTANYNAQIASNAATLERQRTVKQQRLLQGKERTAAAASGGTLDSYDDLFESNNQERLLDLSIMDYNSKLQRDQIIYGGAVESSQAKTRAKNALISGIVNASATGIKSYQSFGDK